ncbi:MAG: glycosyltransferase [Patescibacteria group bacterium]
MKIIIATPLFPPEIEDIANYSRDIAMHLKENNQVQILTYAGPVEEIVDLEIFTINKRQSLLFRISKYFIKLLKLARQVDLIYVQNSVAVSWPAILVKIITGRKVIINFIEDEAWKRSRHLHLTDKSWQDFLAKPELNFKISLIRKLQAWTLRRADKVIVSSQTLAQAISQSYHLPETKLVVNYPVANIAVVLPFEQNIKPNQILVFGSDFDLTSQKVMGDFKLIFLGDKTLAKAEMAYLINTSELIIYNHQSANFDNFLIDCLAAGKNILAHDTSYTQEIIEQAGTLLDFNNKQAVLEKIRHLLANRTEDKDIANIFTWQNHLNKLQEVFQTIVKK